MKTLLSLLAATTLLFASYPADAATFTVTKIADTSDGVCNADCSLREAIAAAVALAGDDVIVFDPTVFSTAKTIVLAGTEIVITPNGSLVIEGPGAGLLTLDGNGASRIIRNDPGAITTIRNIRFSGGNGEGAANSGRGGAIYNRGGNLRVERIVFEGNNGTGGGGMNNASAGTVMVVDSIFAGNTATLSGGAIQNFSTSTLTIVGSTFTGNTSLGDAVGGGAAQLNGIVAIANSTFSGNQAPAGSGGAINSNGSSLQVINSTFTGNSALNDAGGLHRSVASTDVFLRNSIFAGNTSVSGQALDVSAVEAISSLGNNLIGNVGATAGWIGNDLLGQNPLLEALAQNGGPTPTHRLGIGSPAIDAGQDCVVNQSCATENLAFPLTVDQRGSQRPALAATDIGAFEVQPDPIFADRFE